MCVCIDIYYIFMSNIYYICERIHGTIFYTILKTYFCRASFVIHFNDLNCYLLEHRSYKKFKNIKPLKHSFIMKKIDEYSSIKEL